MDEQEPSWQRQLFIGLGALLVVGLAVGGILAVVAVKAADYAGLGAESNSTTPAPLLPTTGSAAQHPTSSPRSSTPSTTKTTSHRPRFAIRLQVSPAHAGSYDRVNLTGSYPGHDGAELQVQRRVGDEPWADFPTTTHVNGDTFATYIQTSKVGVNHLRMLDKATGKTSNVGTVTIG